MSTNFGRIINCIVGQKLFEVAFPAEISGDKGKLWGRILAETFKPEVALWYKWYKCLPKNKKENKKTNPLQTVEDGEFWKEDQEVLSKGQEKCKAK